MKQYDLDIQELREFEGWHMGWWSKGHHDAGAFLAWLPTAIEPFVLSDIPDPERHIRHGWWRCVPVGTDMPGATRLINAKPGTRGAFPVTVIED